MNVDVIQQNLAALIVSLQILSQVQDQVHVDDGQQLPNMEADLQEQGISILVMLPQVSQILEQGKKNVVMGYNSTLWIRTNPKILVDGAPWNPLTLEQLLIPVVIGWIPVNNLGQPPFSITPGLEPETDYFDSGNNSRLVRFSTKVVFDSTILP